MADPHTTAPATIREALTTHWTQEKQDAALAALGVLEARVEAAKKIANEASSWDSSKPFTQEDAQRYHQALVWVIALLRGDLDDFAATSTGAT